MTPIPRLRGTTRALALYGAAGAVILPLAQWAGGSLPWLDTATDLAFVGGSLLVFKRLLESRMARLRGANEALEGRAVTRARDLRHEMDERARAETGLRTAEQRFREIAEAASEFIWEMGPDLRFHFVSQRFVEISGLPVEALLGRSAGELFSPANPADTPLGTWLASRRGFRDVSLAMAVGTSRRLLVLSGRPIFDPTGAFGGYRGTGSDITERRRQELNAERLRLRQELILTSLGEGVFGMDRDGCITFANPAAQAMLGWTAEELTGRVANEILQPDPPDGFTPVTAVSGEPIRSGILLRHKGGNRFPVDYVCTAVMEDGQSIGAVVALRDITEQQRIDAELIAAKERAEAATRAKSDFLAHMSHELRTPLNSIIGFTDVMLGEFLGPVGNPRYTEYIADIGRSGAHLLDLINDMVDLARIEEGKLELDEKPCDMARLVDDAVAIIRPLAAPSGCTLVNNVPGNLPPVIADPRRVTQVLLNLLSNAVKFTPKGGRVAVHARVDGDGTFRLEVVDTGIGIPADEISRVTQVFVQGDNAVARAKGGAGLGLPLAKQLTELHGGQLDIVSHVGSGTTVTLSLPPNRLSTVAQQVLQQADH